MNPALSVIFFTTLSGAGFGLLLWLGLSIALLHANAGAMQSLHALQAWALLLGWVLAVAGLLSSLGHLGKPGRAWRALSQWRTSWLSREGVLALATMLPAVAIGVLLLWVEPGADRAMLLGVSGLLLALLSLATVACTAMIYASLPPIPAWRHPLVLPVYLLFAMLSGLALLFALMAVLLPVAGDARMMLGTIAVLGLLVAVAKWLYWRGIDGEPVPATRGAAVGLPGREVSVFERPHTEQNYITREMAFVVARRHADRLRWLATALLVAGPALALLLASLGIGPATAWLWFTAFAVLAGSVVERWLFFAQARHLVTLYY
ncbi:dimethyl sulfoxide reductase anchor subunit [Luteimonas aestuarii]|uniref:Dimethyl sulfoxide reductase anchor subunit n=1 Tax=Luteimonas aestuarii TaxID=453837 RepID=A0A4R5TK35_9GAMM|nr:DmsC/YnfH family molybdoenzyme membrane anchor subunit [Luteimonas aestuarii]TDK22728.1 dimethyl sulfoxide reductase anchor subunit [Luteimonas aestuarii]